MHNFPPAWASGTTLDRSGSSSSSSSRYGAGGILADYGLPPQQRLRRQSKPGARRIKMTPVRPVDLHWPRTACRGRGGGLWSDPGRSVTTDEINIYGVTDHGRLSAAARTAASPRGARKGKARGAQALPLGPKNTRFSVFLPLNYVIFILAIRVLKLLLRGKTEKACSMVKRLCKVYFSHPTGH